MLRRFFSKKGFSLVEILATVAIISFVVSMSLLGYNNFFENARRTTIKGNMERLFSAANSYYAEMGSAKNLTCAALVSGGYIQACPKGPDTNGTYIFSLSQNGNIEITYKNGNETITMSDLNK